MFINKKYSYALIGASDNQEKYWNIVLRDFLGNGYHIIPINPYDNDGIIEWLQAYKNIKDISEKIDVVIFVVHPDLALQLLIDVVKKGVKKVWFQPWAESPEAIQFCEENGIEHNESGSCIMMERRNVETKEKKL